VVEALRESERFIRSVAEASPHWFYVFDFDRMGLSYANRPILRDLGYPPEVHTTVTGLEAFRAFMPPEEMPHLARLLQEWQTLPDGLVRDDEYLLRHADGSLRYFAGREIVFARRPDGSVQRILGTLLDITGRKRAEEALRAANDELTRFNRAMTGRELRMIELKQEVNVLCARLGWPPRYPAETEPPNDPGS
jgi:PAS domain S-box-containing protein